MNLGIIDTHTHYAHKRFDCGRDEILLSLQECGIKAVLEGAINFESNFKMKTLCEKYPFVYMAAGCHPNLVAEMDEERFWKIRELLKYEKVLAVGETGLDYKNEKSEEQIELQKYWFRRFLELSFHVEKPVVIHCRDAYDDLLEILGSYDLPENPGVIHCFYGDSRQARCLEKLGFYFGVNGMFTNMQEDTQLIAALKEIPLERILLETDCPYLVPEGAAGKRNTSLNLPEIAVRFADLRQAELGQMLAIILENTKKLYPKII